MFLLPLGIIATIALNAPITALFRLRTSIIIRINLAAVIWICVRKLPELIVGEAMPELIPIAFGAAIGTLFAFGFPWWKRDAWRPRNRFDLTFAARVSFRAQRSISSLVVRLGILSIMLGVAVMEVTVSIVYGFQDAIHEKVIGFGAHIRIGNLLEELESEITPLPRYNEFIDNIETIPEVGNIAPYVMKPAMLKAKDPQEGVLLKGLDMKYDWTFFREALDEGEIPDLAKGKRYSKDLLISRKIADLLDVDVGEKVFAYFFQENVRVRTFQVAGIYKTDLGEFDQQFALCDLRALQGIWGWSDDQVAGFEIRLKDIDGIEDIGPLAEQIQEYVPYQYEATPITREYPELFEWVELQHQNVWFILGLMVIVAVINMISVLLILILERTRTIGLLKALGMSNTRVWNIFVANGFFLVLIGLALGNLLGLGLLASQELWGWLTVDQESYFVDVVPVEWVWEWFLAVNLGVLVICTVFMYIPALLVLRISPVRALRFD